MNTLKTPLNSVGKNFKNGKRKTPKNLQDDSGGGGATTVAGTSIILAIATGGTSILLTGMIVGISFGIAGWVAGRKPSNAPLLEENRSLRNTVKQLTVFNKINNQEKKRLLAFIESLRGTAAAA